MKIKRLCAAFLAAVLCMSVFSTTALAYTDETAASSAETVETAPAETTEQETEEVPYSVLLWSSVFVTLMAKKICF